jgi:hypothetical protein
MKTFDSRLPRHFHPESATLKKKKEKSENRLPSDEIEGSRQAGGDPRADIGIFCRRRPQRGSWHAYWRNALRWREAIFPPKKKDYYKRLPRIRVNRRFSKNPQSKLCPHQSVTSAL